MLVADSHTLVLSYGIFVGTRLVFTQGLVQAHIRYRM